MRSMENSENCENLKVNAALHFIQPLLKGARDLRSLSVTFM